MWLYDPMRGYLKEFRTKDVEKMLGKDTVYVCRHSKNEDYNKEIIEKINKISKDKKINFKVFYNDFSKSIEENGKKLKEIIEDEHFRNTN